MKRRSILITGATGIMGSWVLGEALSRGYSPVVLMRDDSYEKARQRIEAVLELTGCGHAVDDVLIVRGDTSKPDLDLCPDEMEKLRKSLDGMIHCAACTSFSPRRDSEQWATNVGGVANVLNFLDGTGIPLYHVSTAYVAGTREGTVLETELDLNQEFHNTYERSKCEAERLVHSAMSDGRVKAAIFRPGIIVGAAEDGRISQFLNLYSFMRFLDIVATVTSSGRRHLRMIGNANATKNIVTVDWTAQALWNIVEAEGASGCTYNLTNPNPITIGEIHAWANEYFGTEEVAIEFVESMNGSATALESAVNAVFRHYRAYLCDEPVFDSTNTERALGDALPCPRIDKATFLRLLSYASERRWQGIFGCKNGEKDEGLGAFFKKYLARAAKKDAAAAAAVSKVE